MSYCEFMASNCEYFRCFPVFLYMGRVAVEKNIGAFLQLGLSGSKVVVGDGPDPERLGQQYPGVLFTSFKFGAELSQHLAAA